MKENIGIFIVAVIYLAILYTLVRPGSKGTQIVGSLSSALSDLVRGVAGQTYNSGTNKWSGPNG
jgi:hypothetical protein